MEAGEAPVAEAGVGAVNSESEKLLMPECLHVIRTFRVGCSFTLPMKQRPQAFYSSSLSFRHKPSQIQALQAHYVSCDFSRRGEVLAASSSLDVLSLFDCERGRLLSDVSCEKYGCEIVRFDPYSSFRGSGTVVHSSCNGFDHSLRLLDARLGRYVKYFKEHRARVLSLEPCGFGRLFISSSEDSSVRLWDFRASASIGRLHFHQGRPVAAFGPLHEHKDAPSFEDGVMPESSQTSTAATPMSPFTVPFGDEAEDSLYNPMSPSVLEASGAGPGGLGTFPPPTSRLASKVQVFAVAAGRSVNLYDVRSFDAGPFLHLEPDFLRAAPDGSFQTQRPRRIGIQPKRFARHVRFSPCGRYVLLTCDDLLVLLDAFSGAEQWRVAVPPFGPRVVPQQGSSAPTPPGGGPPSAVAGGDESTGSSVGRSGTVPMTEFASAEMVADFTPDGHHVCFGNANGGVSFLGAFSGSPVWGVDKAGRVTLDRGSGGVQQVQVPQATSSNDRDRMDVDGDGKGGLILHPGPVTLIRHNPVLLMFCSASDRLHLWTPTQAHWNVGREMN